MTNPETLTNDLVQLLLNNDNRGNRQEIARKIVALFDSTGNNMAVLDKVTTELHWIFSSTEQCL